MKTTEKNYVESYDKQGCLAFVFGALILALLLSLIANGIMFMKIKRDEKTTIKATALVHQEAGCSAETYGIKKEGGILPYNPVEERKPTVQDGESIMFQTQGKGIYSAIGGNRS